MSNYDSGNDSIMEMYLFESETLLDQLDEILLQSEEQGNLLEEDVNEIFRIMHTIKGSSAMMEFEIITHISHILEDLFFVIRDEGIEDEYFEDLMNLVLKVSDFLKIEVEKIKNGEELTLENKELEQEVALLLSCLNGTNDELKKVDETVEEIAVEEEIGSEEDIQLEDEIKLEEEVELDIKDNNGGKNRYYLHARFAQDSQMENIRAFMLVNKLASIGEIIESIPKELNNNPEAAEIIRKEGFACALESSCSEEEVMSVGKSILSVDKICFIDAMPEEKIKVPNKKVDQTIKVKPPLEKKNQSQPQNHKIASQNLINVDLNKLDILMNLIGEIVITESMVVGSVSLEGKEQESFTKASVQLRKLTDELQDIVMSIRMVPVAGTFKKMHRVVRDMTKKLGKNVELITMGETTEVDKTIIDGIADPLMHLVRNAVDHGLETPEERSELGKEPVGKVILSAQNIGGDIVISVSDDGKGLDTKALLEKAKERKILTKPEEEYSKKEILNLLMVAGFSTNETVTEYSGRGVGMDVVKKSIEKIGGSISIESELGSGTNIFLKIPLTLSIISGMQIRVGENICEIPISNIRESFKIKADQLIVDPDDNEMVMIRGVCYPLVRLQEIFKAENYITDIEEGVLMLVDSGDNLSCFFMDELIMKHQIVVKPIPQYLNKHAVNKSGIAGCTILGNGSISLIIDVASILDNY